MVWGHCDSSYYSSNKDHHHDEYIDTTQNLGNYQLSLGIKEEADDKENDGWDKGDDVGGDEVYAEDSQESACDHHQNCCWTNDGGHQ